MAEELSSGDWLEETRTLFVGAWDVIGRRGPILFDEIKVLRERVAARDSEIKVLKAAMTTERAVRVLIAALNEDPGYHIAWQANIAMAFKDEVARNPGASLHDQANAAATNFLAMLCNPALSPTEAPR